MNVSVYRIASLPPTRRKVYLLLHIGLPDARLSRAEARRYLSYATPLDSNQTMRPASQS